MTTGGRILLGVAAAGLLLAVLSQPSTPKVEDSLRVGDEVLAPLSAFAGVRSNEPPTSLGVVVVKVVEPGRVRGDLVAIERADGTVQRVPPLEDVVLMRSSITGSRRPEATPRAVRRRMA